VTATIDLPADFGSWPPWAQERWVWLSEARADQITPTGDWNHWLIMAGRGWGKTRTGAEDIAHYAMSNPKTRIAVVAKTFADARDTCVEGESGLLAIIPPEELRGGSTSGAWNRSIGELFLANGSLVKCYSSEKPQRLRGPQHHRAWCDELAAWDSFDAFDMLIMGLRLGHRPQCVITTTPQPKSLIREMVSRSDVVVTRGSTFDNAKNLSPAAIAQLRARYEGTRLGRQELYAELLEDVPGALFTRSMIEDNRRTENPALVRVVVAIDPAVTSGEDSDETGISVCGLGADNEFYVLVDATMRDLPDAWARKAVELFHEWKADRLIGEANNGGDMIESLLRAIDPNLPYRKVVASRGKRLRAEPISSLYQQGRVHHVGEFRALEDQMVTWVPDVADFSPDRLDALVYALNELSEGSTANSYLNAISKMCPSCSYPNPKTTIACISCGSRFD